MAEAYLVLLLFIAFVGYALAPAIHRQTEKLSQVPALIKSLSAGEIPIEASNGPGSNDGLALRMKSFLSQHRSTVQSLAESVERSAFSAISSIPLIPILAIFFLSDGEELANQLIRLVSTSETHEAVRSLAAELNVMMRHYIRAKVALGCLSFAYASAASLVLRFPNALALGLLAGILEFIPVAGWVIAAATIVTVGVLSHTHSIWMAALLGVWRILMDYWIAPRVMGDELELHPLLAIFTMMVGGAIGGIVGIYLSVPVVAALRLSGAGWALSNRCPNAHRLRFRLRVGE